MTSTVKSQLSALALILLLCTSVACSRLAGVQNKPRDTGGQELLLGLKMDAAQAAQNIERTMQVIQDRCDRLNLYCKLERQNDNQIKLRVSGELDPARVKSVLLAEGMELRAVVTELAPAPLHKYPTRASAQEAAGNDRDVMPYLERSSNSQPDFTTYLIVERTPLVSGQDIRKASAVPYPRGVGDGEYQITFQLKPEAAARFGEWTGSHIDNYLAVVFNREVRTAAYIKSQITDSGEIVGRFTKQEAEDMAQILMSGNLPAPVSVLKEGTYKP